MCERLVLLNKSKKCLGIENKGGLGSSRGKSAYTAETSERKKCHL